MAKLDLNKLAVLVALIVLAILAVRSGYRIDIGAGGFKFESNTAHSTVD